MIALRHTSLQTACPSMTIEQVITALITHCLFNLTLFWQRCFPAWIEFIFFFSFFKICNTQIYMNMFAITGEDNGIPLQGSCLENPMDGGAWWTAVQGVTKSRTRLSDFTDFSLSCIGEGNGNPLQCSYRENPRDGAAWWAAVCGVAQSQTRLKRLSSSSMLVITGG